MTENTLSKCWICGGRPSVNRLRNNTYQIRCKKCNRTITSDFVIMAMRHWNAGDVNYRTKIEFVRSKAQWNTPIFVDADAMSIRF